MFKTKTLFILGAGASVPYGYPVGKDLIKNIIKDMQDDIFIPKYESRKDGPYWNKYDKERNVLYDFNECEQIFKDIESNIDEILNCNYRQCDEEGSFQICHARNKQNNHSPKLFFKTQINQVKIFNELKEAVEILDPVSIDAFLRDNPSHVQAGKIMIVYSILKREDTNKFNINQNDDNWYSLLLNDLVSECADNPDKLTENEIEFITFNYDMSLDYFLHSRIKKIENFIKIDERSHSPALIFLNKLKLEHVYGQLYSLANNNHYGKYIHTNEENKHFGLNAINASSSTSLTLIKNFQRFVFSFKQYNNIKTMYDERNNPTQRNDMIVKHKEALKWAEEIIFIGFGFDRDNLNLLGFPDTLSRYNDIFFGKTIRYMNYKGIMKSLPLEFKNIENKIVESLNSNSFEEKGKAIKIIQSTAEYIIGAYQNDFKKFLLK